MKTEKEMQAYVLEGKQYDVLWYLSSVKDKYAAKKLIESDFISQLLERRNMGIVRELSEDLGLPFEDTKKSALEVAKRILHIALHDFAALQYITEEGSEEDLAHREKMKTELESILKEPVFK
jgi:hypothetical protein